MQRFFTGRLDGPQCSGKPLKPIGEVELGETFIVDTSLDQEPDNKGPVFIKNVKPGNVVAIRIESIHTIMPYQWLDPDYGIIPEILDRQRVQYVKADLKIEGQEFILPGGIRLPVRPMIGTISLAAEERCPNPWDHGGNMDVNEIGPGAIMYIRAQREGGLLALGDLHAHQGDGEISGTGLEASGYAQVTVEISNRFPAPRPVVERDGKVMTVGMGLRYWEAVRSAVRDMTYLLMDALALTLEEANCVAVRGNLRNGAIWMMSDHHLITMVEGSDRIPRTVFLEIHSLRSRAAKIT